MTARTSSAREVARRVLARVGERGAWATLALTAELTAADLDERDRRFATELVYGTLRHQLRLERALAAHAELGKARPPVRAALLVAAYQLLFLRVPSHAAVDDAVTAVRARFGPKLGGFVNAVLRKLATTGEPPLPTAPRARLALEHSLTPWLIDEVAAQVPADELAAAVAGLTTQAPLWIRVNRTRATPAEVIAALTKDGATVTASPYDDHALAVEGLGDPARAPTFRVGLWTVQDLAAQLVGRMMAPEPGERVLDVCAAPGGKTTAIGERLDDRGLVVAHDRATEKLPGIRASAERLGLSCVQVVPVLPRLEDPPFDRVLVDAPCSGLGTLRRHPEIRWRFRDEDLERLVRIQRGVLAEGAARVRVGGTLVYSVCTVTAHEGPGQLEGAECLAGFERVDERHTGPHEAGAPDGFYAAKLVRRR